MPTLSPRTGVRVFGLDGGCGRGTERVELTGSAVLSLRVGHFRDPLPVCSACTVRDPASSVIHACSTTSTTSTPHLRCPVACVVRHQRLLTYSRACTWSSTCYSAPTTQTARAATTTVTGPRLARRQDSAYRLKSVPRGRRPSRNFLPTGDLAAADVDRHLPTSTVVLLASQELFPPAEALCKFFAGQRLRTFRRGPAILDADCHSSSTAVDDYRLLPTTADYCKCASGEPEAAVDSGALCKFFFG